MLVGLGVDDVRLGDGVGVGRSVVDGLGVELGSGELGVGVVELGVGIVELGLGIVELGLGVEVGLTVVDFDDGDGLGGEVPPIVGVLT